MQWSIDFSIHFDQEVIKEAEIVAAANIVAGVQVGIGDYRPKFGRFKAEFNKVRCGRVWCGEDPVGLGDAWQGRARIL